MSCEEEYDQLQEECNSLHDQITALEVEIDDLESELNDREMHDLRTRGRHTVDVDQVWQDLTTVERPLLCFLDELFSNAKGYTPERLSNIVLRSSPCKQS